MSSHAEQKNSAVTVSRLAKIKQAGEKFACLTAYDASFAAQLEAAGVEVILVGDSLGMVVQGYETTVPVTIEEIIYHTQCVARARQNALLMADMPFMTYATPEQAIHNAARLMREGGAQMVKLEGAAIQVETVRELAARGIPVCAHIGLQPQLIHKLGGYRVQGRETDAARAMVADAIALQNVGADILLLECVPTALAAEITQTLSIPVIGIGAGPETDGQILVLYDMLGITFGRKPSFVKDFMVDTGDIGAAVRAYVTAVKNGTFPAPEHSFE
ncbi:MAG: 3-methyl-2-oxobutanoate hydroxymethyltransferase [Proteobacteria bacterium]|nr:MAG: 3-methyl-2-oxobutanoate hydroxymethyltransferase [Pseudomonadota bacterium]QKK11813.1 MAG: 3-methyl-2-oxobutanoate hydroxymethyltransferase [Pseudomonadota bacterium]